MSRARRSVVTVHARILVADDDVDLLEAVAEALEGLGAEVVRARSGDELIEKVGEEGPFDLVVTDVSMPWMTGLQAMHSARTAGLETPIIVMTALRDAAIPRQVGTLGTNALLLRKPFPLADLEAATRQLLVARQPGAGG